MTRTTTSTAALTPATAKAVPTAPPAAAGVAGATTATVTGPRAPVRPVSPIASRAGVRSAVRDVTARYQRWERRTATAVRSLIVPGFWVGSLYTGLLVAVFVLTALDHTIHMVPLLIQVVCFPTTFLGRRRSKWLMDRCGANGVDAPLLYRRLATLSMVQAVAIISVPFMGDLIGGPLCAWFPWSASLQTSAWSAVLVALNAGACAAVLTEQVRIWGARRRGTV